MLRKPPIITLKYAQLNNNNNRLPNFWPFYASNQKYINIHRYTYVLESENKNSHTKKKRHNIGFQNAHRNDLVDWSFALVTSCMIPFNQFFELKNGNQKGHPSKLY